MKKKKYKIQKSNEIIKKLQPHIKQYLMLQDDYYMEKELIEEAMRKVTKIKDIEIFEFECGWAIGNTSRTMELIHDQELIDGKIDKK